MTPGEGEGLPLNQYDQSVGDPAPPFDPLRLCVFTTVALLAWVFGPVAVLAFAVIGILGYARARRGGLLRSKCKLGDTRLVIAYLSLVALAAAAALVFWVLRLLPGSGG
ncbi:MULTISPECIES: hypothetical protein [Arthrobacter]|uniref:DUF4190 domain-containing protein n=2 Tax=Arthrobacter TaxID=1663 RepID=A0ABU9KI97_9MICC|nr:hypothetical protein [Arthrobacter sp. YJM1]MDP5226382.1 hypothetical protein [Arthrobacter sp. YJM1]